MPGPEAPHKPSRTVERAFVRTVDGLIHYRFTGTASEPAPALILAHGGPGSSNGFAPLMQELVERRVIAPDMMGNGESDPPPRTPTDISLYADGIVAVADRLGLATFDLYGHHTGAQVCCEVAIAHPQRVRRLILDGSALFSEAERLEYLERYAPPVVAEPDGRHLGEIWRFVSQMTQHFPHYRQDPEHAITGGRVLPAALLTTVAAEVLKSWSTFHLAYEASFRHDLRARLPLLTTPTLVLAARGDPLAVYAPTAVDLIPGALLQVIDRTERPGAIRRFLDAETTGDAP